MTITLRSFRSKAQISLSFLSEQCPGCFAWQFERVDDPKELRVKGEISLFMVDKVDRYVVLTRI
jgi:hypothetical protein